MWSPSQRWAALSVDLHGRGRDRLCCIPCVRVVRPRSCLSGFGAIPLPACACCRLGSEPQDLSCYGTGVGDLAMLAAPSLPSGWLVAMG